MRNPFEHESRTMKNITRTFACAAALFALLSAPAHAQEVKAGDLVITQAWSRATP
jgi:periplasmic copper chaperone A